MICPICGLTTGYYGDSPEMCAHHTVMDDNWSKGNRIMCDFFHRRIIPPRLTEPERDDDFWAQTGNADAGI